MTLRKRILLILSGVAVFILAGPVIIFIAQGYSFDFSQNRLIPGGTLVIKTQPRGASVILDGDEMGRTPLTKRFLHPGEYQLEIILPGYLPRTTRISIFPSQVTFVPRNDDRVFLFLQPPKAIQQIEGVTDVFLSGNVIYYATSTESQMYSMKFSNGSVSPAATTTRPQVDNDNYYISRVITGENLLYHKSPLGTDDLITIVPPFQTAQIIASPGNHLYLVLDEALYEVNNSLTKLRSPVTFASWDRENTILVYGNRFETWMYDPFGSAHPKLLIRSSSGIASPVVHKATGYAFWIENHQIKAIEINSSSEPKVYSLLTADDPKKIFLDKTGGYLTVLDGQILKLFRIR